MYVSDKVLSCNNLTFKPPSGGWWGGWLWPLQWWRPHTETSVRHEYGGTNTLCELVRWVLYECVIWCHNDEMDILKGVIGHWHTHHGLFLSCFRSMEALLTGRYGLFDHPVNIVPATYSPTPAPRSDRCVNLSMVVDHQISMSDIDVVQWCPNLLYKNTSHSLYKILISIFIPDKIAKGSNNIFFLIHVKNRNDKCGTKSYILDFKNLFF